MEGKLGKGSKNVVIKREEMTGRERWMKGREEFREGRGKEEERERLTKGILREEEEEGKGR